MKIKVCGMRDQENIRQLAELNPDYMGFIFYPKSSRYVGDIDKSILSLPSSIKKTAVFVNANLELVKRMLKHYDFDAVQLHGDESVEYCNQLKSLEIEVIKAFGIHNQFEWEGLASFKNSVHYFLFDTLTSTHGGSGNVFNWEILGNYTEQVPYFLSGGISVENFEQAASLEDSRLYGLDLNSKFEFSPALKDIKLLETVLKHKNE